MNAWSLGTGEQNFDNEWEGHSADVRELHVLHQVLLHLRGARHFPGLKPSDSLNVLAIKAHTLVKAHLQVSAQFWSPFYWRSPITSNAIQQKAVELIPVLGKLLVLRNEVKSLVSPNKRSLPNRIPS